MTNGSLLPYYAMIDKMKTKKSRKSFLNKDGKSRNCCLPKHCEVIQHKCLCILSGKHWYDSNMLR